MSFDYLTCFSQSSFKPVQPNSNDDNVDETEVGDNWYKINEKLLIRLQVIDIDAADCIDRSASVHAETIIQETDVRIQTRLRRRAGTEEVGIDSGNVAEGVDYDEPEEAHR